MRRFLLGLVSLGLTASPQSAPDGFRRIDYSLEKFSIAIPVAWTEIEPSVLATLPTMVRQAAPNAPQAKVLHGYKASELGFPGVAIATTEGHVDEKSFLNLGWAHHSVDQFLEKLGSTDAAIEHAQLNDVSYDASRHLLWGATETTSSRVGEIRTLSGAYLTTTGSIQVHCYTKAPDFVKDEPVCKQIIESVAIDPAIALPPNPPKSPVLDGLRGTDYETLVQRVEAGDFSVDFRALRLACMKSPKCEPRGTKADLAAINRAVSEHDDAKVVEIGERLIQQGFVNIEAHATCVKAYEALHDAAKSKYHLDVAQALLFSILLWGDGETEETALQVISDREEYETLVARGLPYSGRGVSASKIEEGGHHYDRWQVVDPNTGNPKVIFFNTDAFSSKSRVRAN